MITPEVRSTPETLLDALLDARRVELALLDDLSDAQMLGPRGHFLEPPIWEMGHVGWFQEYWLLRRLDGADPLLPGADEIYDSFNVSYTQRWDHRIPSRARRAVSPRRPSRTRRSKPSSTTAAIGVVSAGAGAAGAGAGARAPSIRCSGSARAAAGSSDGSNCSCRSSRGTRSCTSTGTRRKRSVGGPGGRCPPRRSGRWPPRYSRRPDASVGSRGETRCPHPTARIAITAPPARSTCAHCRRATVPSAVGR